MMCYRFCLIKVLTIIVFIIISICIIAGGIGGTVYGVKYFASDIGGGPFNDGFVGVLNGNGRVPNLQIYHCNLIFSSLHTLTQF